jgi:enoyl-CoA hydratase
MDSIQDIVTTHEPQPGILHIRLNRPGQLNALNQDVLRRLSQLFQQAKQDASIKAILLSGEGKAFCAGADIKELAALTGADGLAFARFGQSVFRQLELLGKPSIAAIQGFAFGGGCELAMAATLRIAANNAVFGQPEIKLGVIPGFGGTQRLSRLIGKGRALEVCLTGRRFSAEEAHAWGLVNELTAPADLEARALALLAELTKLAPLALQSIITVVQQGYDLAFAEAEALEAAHFGLCCTTADKREGVSAFLEKRTATFSGE